MLFFEKQNELLLPSGGGRISPGIGNNGGGGINGRFIDDPAMNGGSGRNGGGGIPAINGGEPGVSI